MTLSKMKQSQPNRAYPNSPGGQPDPVPGRELKDSKEAQS